MRRTRRAGVAGMVALGLCAAWAGCGRQPLVQLACDPGDMVVVSPAAVNVSVGERARVLGLGWYACRNGRPVTWSVRDAAVAAIAQVYDTAGMHAAIIVARAPGETVVIGALTERPDVRGATVVTVPAQASPSKE